MIALRALRSLSPLSTSQKFLSRQVHGGVLARREDDVSSIHPTAVVHPDAVIGKGVVIGPFCTVGSDVNIGNACQLHPASHIMGDTQLGERCVVQTAHTLWKYIEAHHNELEEEVLQSANEKETSTYTSDASSNVIANKGGDALTCDRPLGISPSVQEDYSFLHVGDNNDIREYVSIHRSSKSSDKTVIGDNNLIMGSCHIAHDCKVGKNNIFANSTLFGGHVVVEDYTHTAGAVVIHQFCHIGSYSFIGGGSVISQDVPKYMMVSGDRAELRGLNLEGLRRCGFSSMEVRRMRKAYQKIFMPNDANLKGFEDRLSEVEENEELAESPVVHSMVKSIRESFEESRRGICKFTEWSGT